MEGFVGARTLGGAFMSARNNLGWFGGYANLDFEADMGLGFQNEVLQQLRADCLLQSDCVCL
jgi:hypothetical protein